MEHATRPARREGAHAVRRLTHTRRASAPAAHAEPVAVSGPFVLSVLAVVCGACASLGMPPGGPLDRSPPALLRVTPDTGTLNARIREVQFRFDEVVSERPRGAQSLEQIVVVSPSDGQVILDWRRDVIAVRPRRGWRANTAYTVTILPGLSDLRGNATTKPLHTEFSTGSVMPRAAVRGAVFDWVGQRVASGARIEAMHGPDTTLKYIAAADSSGRFLLRGLPSGTLLVRAFLDQNSNRALDSLELWDSTTVSLADSARRDFYAFAHSSVGPRPVATASDSVTVRVRFDKPVAPSARLDSSSFDVWRAIDSARVIVRRALPAPAYDSLAESRKRFAADSASRSDTSAAGRLARARADSARERVVRDSISNAQIAALRALRDTVTREPAPKPARPAPVSEYVLELATPLVSGTQMWLEARNATGLSGAVRPGAVRFVWRRPERKDSTATKVPPAKKP